MGARPRGVKARVIPTPLRIDCEATAALIERFIKREVQESGLAKVVLGLSGGVDSGVVAALCARALGRASVKPFLLPYKSSSRAHTRDAVTIARQLGLRAQTVDITPMAKAYLDGRRLDRIRKGNILARLRMMILFDMAKKHKALVAGTSNKTETYLGYSTWYGDSACSFQPIGDLYKSQVWQLAEWLDLPESVIRKVPSADLWPGQTDEGELGIEYAQADRILHALIDRGLQPAAVVQEGLDRASVDRVVRAFKSTEYKRRLPNVAPLSARSRVFDRAAPA
jgi:NAD+ synthase